ncbi:hypothetical protein N7537_001281 [Penicillium hordei]|uniref:Gamma-glutamylcyclotransferase AIG2-like domain-containing protein n=1 Tax=Penicillium hordei TaxID=40994 RepID=A0AAD6EGX0_9EURO|nr:uncharacterized protein N7537_001281 [Penicillium hordei]KAJ5616167.1 hypothetical protein N7537_001281 [Penicillium hordei]
MSDKRPSPMLRKFLEYNDSADTLRHSQTASDNSAEDGWPIDPSQREYCFFYGTLMDPHTLCQVLKSSERPPIMRRARVIGFEIKLWGPYTALLDGEPFLTVEGVTFMWDGQRDELQEGTFDLKQWKKEKQLGDLD